MALRNEKDEPFTTADQWTNFFTQKMQFSQDASEKYAKYLVNEGFNGDILEDCIEDPDMKSNIGMLMGEYKKLKSFIKGNGHNRHAGPATSSGPISKIPRPIIKMESSQLDFDQFSFEWKTYKRHYGLNDVQASTNLFFCCSEELRQHIRTKQGRDDWKEEDLLQLIKNIATSKVSAIVHIQEFMNMKQHTDEKCQEYLRRLQIKASCCDFVCSSCKASNINKRVKEKFIIGLRDTTVQTHVIKTESVHPNTPLDKILTEAITIEQSMREQATISNDTVDTALMAEDSTSEGYNDHVNAVSKKYQSTSPRNPVCNGCGSKNHQNNERSEKCKAWRLKCNFCGTTGHLAKVCRKAKSKNTMSNSNTNSFNVKSIEMNCMFIGEVSSLSLSVFVKPLNLGYNRTTNYIRIDCFPDTGANICLIGTQQLQRLHIRMSNLTRCNNYIAVAGGMSIVATGWFRAQFKLNEKTSVQIVYFSDKAKRFFLSRQVCMDLGVVPTCFPQPPISPPSKGYPSLSNTLTVHKLSSINEIKRVIPQRPSVIPFEPCESNIPKLEKYLLDSFAHSSFNASKPFPKLSTPPAHIHLKPGLIPPKPAYWPATVAEHWAADVKKLIDKDVEAGILTEVPLNEPTIWCARMVVVPKKDGRPRRTVDFQQLNSCCIREPNHGKSPFHTARSVPANTWKSIFDAVDGYHSVELDSESSKLTTFITPWGRYRYLRFPQGHHSAGDAFNGRVQRILSHIQRLVRVVDDICIFDNSIEGAFWHAWELLETCARHGIVINKSKLQFCKRSIVFAGLSITNHGIQPSPRVLAAIKDFPPPTDITKARAFFGLVNQLQWAYANCSEMSPFRELVKPKSSFVWTNELKTLFEKCKAKILHQVKEGVRKYDTNRFTCLQTDYSKHGLGYLLLQKYCTCPLSNAPICCNTGWRLVFAGSRFTKGAEERYFPTEGELLAVSWALNHAHVFTKGCPNLLISTDHKPLLGILNNKPFENIVNPRILRLKEKTLPYNFTIQYNKGKWHRGPDALSRSPQMNLIEMLEPITVATSNHQDIFETDAIMALTNVCEISSISIEDVKKATGDDILMKNLMDAILKGFPQTQHLTDPQIRNFFNVKQHLWIQDDIVMFKDRIVIPPSLREKTLSLLHSAHQGVEGMKARAANSIYWPGLNVAIRQKRENCNICNRIAPSQAREPIQMLETPVYPFQYLSIDAFELCNHHYLAAVDKFSGWLIVFHIKCSPKSKHIIDSLRSIFRTFGTPQKLYTDGGTPFQSHEILEFLKSWKVDHVTSSARYAQSNGRAELAVKSAKRILYDNTSPDGSLNTNKAAQALLQYRNTPIQHLGLSPSQILFHRNLRGNMPLNLESLKPNKLWILAARQRELAFAKRNHVMTDSYNRNVKQLPVIEIGADVIIQDITNNKKRWNQYGTVVDRKNRKYTIRAHGSGRIITRNRRFIKKVLLRDFSVCDEPTDIPSDTTPDATQVHQPEYTQANSNPQTDVEVNSQPPVAHSQTPKLPRMLQRLLPYNKPGLKE